MTERRRFKQTKSLKERLLEDAKSLREEAKLLPPGPVRDAVLKKARQSEAAAHMDDWINSPGLRPPSKDDTPGRLVTPDDRIALARRQVDRGRGIVDRQTERSCL